MSNNELGYVLRQITNQLMWISEPQKIDKILNIRHWELSSVLNEQARRDRRNSMFLSIIFLLYEPLNISVNSIAGGISIDDNNELIPLMICVCSFYFTILFLIKVINSIKGVWVSVIIGGFTEQHAREIEKYDRTKDDDAFIDQLKNLKRDNMKNLYGQINLYDALRINVRDYEIVKGYFLQDNEINRQLEFEYEDKSRGNSHPDVGFYKKLRWKFLKGFFRPTIFLELFLPWSLFICVIIYY